MTLIIIIALLLSTLLITSCETTKNDNGEVKRSQEEIQEDFNVSATYFIENDGPKLIEYMDKDQTLTTRDKQPTKRRLRNLNSIIQEMKTEE